jgi:hypothetical protein
MKNGLKGITDATVFCKSMKKGNEKNQMIRSMKSYMTGGATSLSSPNTATSESDCSGGPGKGGCRKKFKSKGKSTEGKGGVLGGLLGAAAAVGGGMWMKNKMEKGKGG